MGMLLAVFLYILISSFSPAFSDSKSSDDFVPCDRGWYHFRNKCYRAGARKASETLTWTRALDRCKNYGGNLVSIQSQEEQDFIVAFMLLDIKRTAFTGLNDRDKEQDFKWTDGSVYNYSNWYPNEPSTLGQKGVKGEDCMEMYFHPEKNEIGPWNDVNCEYSRAYICEKNTNPRRNSPNLMYCSPEDGGGWKYQTSCYHVVTEMKSWKDAEKHCKIQYNGHLLTIRDKLEDYFLELGIPGIKKEMWIGIKVKNQFQQKWTSGWYVSYDGFNAQEKNVIGETCVARKGRAEWVTLPCSRQLPFICEVSKASPPVLKMPPPGAHCPIELDDWRDLGGDYCYYIETTKTADYFQARYACTRRGGDLVSLHSQEEADILHQFVKYKQNNIYIGLMRLMGNNEETFAWIDGSKLDYQNWDYTEPDKIEEKCVEARTGRMEWHDIPCSSYTLGYICSVKKIISKSSTVDETSDCTNFCIAPTSYLHGIISQCPEAQRMS